jgi:putative ABC transport system ATP-binding protein
VTTLELVKLVKHYRSEGEVVRAVDGVSLALEAGEFVALFGPSGSGKTTLLKLAASILAPDSGSVRFEGTDVARLGQAESARYRRRDIGFIFQTFHLMGSSSALDNAAVKLIADGASVAAARSAAKPWLERVGLAQRATQLPGRLSTGECQRVAIARALVNGPRLLLADEPTGNLDSRRGREVLALLRELAHEDQVAVLLATHDAGAMDYVDRACTLMDGTLSEGLAPALDVGAA